MTAPLEINIDYDAQRISGRFRRSSLNDSSIWERLRARAFTESATAHITDDTIELSWPSVLRVIRDFGSKQQQVSLGFRFVPTEHASALIRQFALEVKAASAARAQAIAFQITQDEIQARLAARGFTKRSLRQFQLRDLQRLVSLPHGANFSVPGAGKTTVTFALHLLTEVPRQHLFVVSPKSAFPAWRSVISECLSNEACKSEPPFQLLEGSADQIEQTLRTGSRFLISYDLMIRQSDLIANHFARHPVHLVLDEAHRMKAGYGSQRGAFLINVASLLKRRDILTGTPMPQGPEDLAAQLSFLWPAQGLDTRIWSGDAPREVLGDLYVRTTKRELGLPPAVRHFRTVEMLPGQMALYGVVRDEALRQLANATGGRNSAPIDYIKARRSVMRLLQLSANPILAVEGITQDTVGLSSGVIDQVLKEGPSSKMMAVESHVRELAATGQKSVVWTIFTDTIIELERMLADLNPVSLYGAIPSGDDSDLATREGRIARFHRDAECKVLIANPAAAGEGISLHTVCHNALYLDRSYVSTHYLQSIDRIHRLGLSPETETNIFIYQTKAPAGLGSIDYSVSRRLATKIRGLQQLLDDPDLHEVALDEENADDPIDFDVDLQDLLDLVAELEGKNELSPVEADEVI